MKEIILELIENKNKKIKKVASPIKKKKSATNHQIHGWRYIIDRNCTRITRDRTPVEFI